MKLRWPWDHTKVDRHIERVARNEVRVQKATAHVQEIKDPLGAAVARALQHERRRR